MALLLYNKVEEGRGKKEDIVLIDVICYAKVLLDSRKVLSLHEILNRYGQKEY